MVRLVLQLGVIALGASLLTAGRLEAGLTCVALGVLGLAAQGRTLRDHQAHGEQVQLIATFIDDVNARIERSETPDQIAAALATRGVAPIVLLQVLARHYLQILGHGAALDRVAAHITWLASSAPPDGSPLEDLATLDATTTLHAMTFGVRHFADDDESTWDGAIIATRRHFFFLTKPHHESLTTAFAKGAAGGWLPELLSLANLGRELTQLTRDHVEAELSPRRRAEFVEWFGQPGSLAISWQDIAEVDKATAPDDGKKVDLVVVTTPNLRHRFRLGTGLKESFVEDWVDLTRTAAALRGVFLPPRS